MTTLIMKKNDSPRLLLKKDSNEGLKEITLGLGWSTTRTVVEKKGGFFGLFGGTTTTRQVRGPSIDLDASCLIFDSNKALLDNVYFANRRAKGIYHLGDDRTGNDKKTKTDNEQIQIDLSQVNERAKYLVFTINSFTGQKFSQVSNAYCRVLDKDREVVRVELDKAGNHTAVILAVIEKTAEGKWQIRNITETANANMSSQLVDKAKRLI